MNKISSKHFYLRHHSEIVRYIGEETKTLYITGGNPDKKIQRIPNLEILSIRENQDINSLITNLERYDLVVVTDIFEIIYDIYNFLKQIQEKLSQDSTLIVSTVNNVWNPVLKIFEFFNLKNSSIKRSYIPIKKFNVIARTAGFEIINTYTRQYFPFKFFYIGNLFNNLIELIMFRFNLGIRTYLVFKKEEVSNINSIKSKTIIIPAKNEAGNLKNLIDRIPRLEGVCEIIISCGVSSDKTLDVARSIESNFFKISVIEQSLNGKANAVWEALDISQGEVIAILDADISVDPETLEDFFEIIDTNKADFVNGTRLIYSMEKGAMRFINILGNRTFQKIVSMMIGQPLTDSLCGTKVFKSDLKYELKKWQNTINYKDPFCDYDLIFSAAYSGKKILELPVHYKSRVYGATQISRFRDGYKLIKYLVLSFYIFNSSNNHE